jgi:hypothetical protein
MVLCFFLGLASDDDPPTYASHVSVIKGMNNNAQLSFVQVGFEP